MSPEVDGGLPAIVSNRRVRWPMLSIRERNPQILSAYDEVIGWVTSENLTVDGAPREVYFTDFVSAGPTDEVCDVACPIQNTSTAGAQAGQQL